MGLFLIATAGMKAHGFVIDPFSQDSFLSSPRLQVAVIEVEALLGFWLLSGWARRGAWVAALALFCGLAGASLVLALTGQPSCGCFGRVAVSPWLTLGLDLAIVAALAYYRPGRSAGLPAGSFLRGLLATAVGAVAFLILIGGSFLLASDNPADILAGLRGESVTVEPQVSELGDGVAGEDHPFVVSLRNHTSRSIRIVGGTSSCSCLATHDLPVTLAPHQSCSVEVRMAFRGEPGRFQHQFNFYTDDDAQRVLIARFRGRVVATTSP